MQSLRSLVCCLIVVATTRCGLLWISDTARNDTTPPTSGKKSPPSFYVRNGKHERVIVFVHGIFGDAISTWTSATGTYWPTLLARDPIFNEVDIYVHSFPSPTLHKSYDTDELADRLRLDLNSSDVLRDHKEAIFLCHSMGGLVVRAFLLKERLRPEQVPMLYFFSTPTTGAELAHLAAILSQNPQADYLLPGDAAIYVRKLQADWLDTALDPALDYPRRIASYCSYEKLSTYGVKVVEQQSATALCNRPLQAIDKDHSDIVKPTDFNSDSYRAFRDAYRRTFLGSASPEEPPTLNPVSVAVPCPVIFVNFNDGTVNGLSPTATQAQITRTLPCATGIIPDSSVAGRVNYDNYGVTFVTITDLIDVAGGATEQFPRIFGETEDVVIRTIGQASFHDSKEGNAAKGRVFGDINRLQFDWFRTPYGCLVVAFADGKSVFARIDSHPCEAMPTSIDGLAPQNIR